MNTIDLIKPVAQNQGWLFKRMASKYEGWAVNEDGRSVDVPLNDLDNFAVRLLTKTVELKEKTVLAMPRLTPGIALSLAAYATVNRFIAEQGSGPDALNLAFQGFSPLKIQSDAPIIVITKNRKLRDYYLSSTLSFSGHTFSFQDFPIYRIKPNGELASITKTISTSKKLAPVIFYHLNELEKIPHYLAGAVVIVELDGSNSRQTLSRLDEFVSNVDPAGVFVVTSSFATSTVAHLKTNNYGIVSLRPEIVFRHSGLRPNLPSLSSASAGMPALTELKIESLSEPDFDEVIYRIHSRLNQISRDLKSDLPSVFYSARTMFSLLKNLAVPLGQYESKRKVSGHVKSVKFLLNKIFASAYIDMTEEQKAVILPVWSSIGNDFYKLYDLLLDRNPKFEAVMKRFESNNLDSESILGVYDSSQSLILRSLLMQDVLVESSETEVNVYSIKEIGRKGLRNARLVTTGLWQSRDDSCVLGTMPEEIDLICYGAEIPSVASTLKRLQDMPLSNEAWNHMQKLGLVSKEIDPSSFGLWIQPTPDAESTISAGFDSASDIELNEEDIYPDTDFEVEDFDVLSDLDDDSDRTYYIIETDNGEEYKLPSEQNVLAYSPDTNKVRSLSPQSLTEGDSLLAVNEESNREIFHELLDRTKDISGADSNYVEIWDGAMSVLRELKAECEDVVFMQMFELLHCEKSSNTIKSWANGDTLAPKDVADVEIILRVAGVKRWKELAIKISEEIEKIRSFHRSLGKKIHYRLGSAARGDSDRKHDALDLEIDEILDLATIMTIVKVDGPVIGPIAKQKLLVLR